MNKVIIPKKHELCRECQDCDLAMYRAKREALGHLNPASFCRALENGYARKSINGFCTFFWSVPHRDRIGEIPYLDINRASNWLGIAKKTLLALIEKGDILASYIFKNGKMMKVPVITIYELWRFRLK